MKYSKKQFFYSVKNPIVCIIVIYTASKDDYVYDLYAVKDGNVSMMEENSSSPFPL